MGKTTDAAWESFLDHVRQARMALDGTVPVAIIFLPATEDSTGELNVDLEAGGKIIWPATFPIKQRGALLEQLAKPYRVGKVERFNV